LKTIDIKSNSQVSVLAKFLGAVPEQQVKERTNDGRGLLVFRINCDHSMAPALTIETVDGLKITLLPSDYILRVVFSCLVEAAGKWQASTYKFLNLKLN
jgi:hypothetical protein